MYKYGFLIIFFAGVFSPTQAQLKEKIAASKEKIISSKKKIEQSDFVQFLQDDAHSAKKAAIYSAVVPGWGQAYNKKYWKVPIVWGAMAGVGYYFFDNNSNYKQFKEHYILLSTYPDSTVQIGTGIYDKSSLSNILQNIDSYRKNRDLSVIIMAAVWGLNIIDANVDGHFFSFDIDEDLSLGVQPSSWMLGPRKNAYGLSLVLNMY